MTVSATQSDARTRNPLRPERLDDVVGQTAAKRLMRRAVESSHERVEPMPHTLLIAPSGTGKSTFSHVVANELGVEVYEVEAPVSYDTLVELRATMRHGDILKIEEIHQQGIMERRGRSSGCQPEVLYAIMEDRTMPTQQGVLPWPFITVFGTTTDEGRLPDAFVNRFPLRPRLAKYTHEEMRQIAEMNAAALSLAMTPDALRLFSTAARGVPRELNNLMRNAMILTRPGEPVTRAAAEDVLELNGITADGLTADMQAMLTFLARSPKFQASVNTIATAIGKSRDSKAISLRVEPYLIERGYVQVTHSGRRLTDAGARRASELLRDKVGA